MNIKHHLRGYAMAVAIKTAAVSGTIANGDPAQHMLATAFNRHLPAVVGLFVMVCVFSLPEAGQILASHNFTATNLLALRQLLCSNTPVPISIEVEATICALNEASGALILQDAFTTDLLILPGMAKSLAAGQQVRLTATHCEPLCQRTALLFPPTSSVHLEVLSQHQPPAPTLINPDIPMALGDSNLWASLEGQVTFLAERAAGWWMELRSPNRGLLQVEVIGPLDWPEEMLVKSRVRVTGLAVPLHATTPRTSIGLVAIPGNHSIQILHCAPEVWTAYPLRPLTGAIAPTNRAGRVVHLAGFLQRASLDSETHWSLGNGEARVTLESTKEAAGLLETSVEALGVLRFRGQDPFLENYCLRPAPGPDQPKTLPWLTSSEQVLRLERDEALRRYPVRLRGVITSVLPGDYRNFVLQDHTAGIFIYATNLLAGQCPQLGECWQIEGVSGAGAFSPFVLARHLQRIGAGQLPEPVRPTWDQIIDGSLDNQYVEIEGIITDLGPKALQLLTHWGKITITTFGRDPRDFTAYEDKRVRLRGCLKALWDGTTHQLKFGAIRLDDLLINIDQAAPGEPFSGPVKAARDLKLFDYQAGIFRRVHVAGQIIGRRADEFILLDGQTGLRFIANATNQLDPGDYVEVVGYPELGRPSPILHDTLVRKTGTAPLPLARLLSLTNLLQLQNDSTRVQLEGVLVNLESGRGETILEMRHGLQPFVARVPGAGGKRWERGSQMRLTGVYAGQAAASLEGDSLAAFELWLNSPWDIQVLARPPWWTFRRLLVALGLLLAGLALAGMWIILLRRQVGRRTAQLERANRQREQTERARVLDEERLRIARDLHDDLGSTLTEITMLGSMGLSESERDRSDYISQIVKKALASVNALDVIVWAVNPRENTLQSLADYLASFTDEFLSSSGISCRIHMPVSFPVITLEGRTRHELFLAAKEALNNAIRHGHPSEVELSVALKEKRLLITVKDNGVGFDPARQDSSHGLGNMRGRLEILGGNCQIESAVGNGTTITLELLLPIPAADTPFAV
jgi:signal transduction histidine kinase